jgi:cardiolipin-specific phospholipase
MATQFVRWWTGSSHTHLLNSEHRLLSAFVKTSFRKPSFDANSIPSKYINWVEFSVPNGQSDLPTVVLTHGFGSGLGFFYRNIDDLLNSGKIGRLIAIDWLGMGGSSRVSCRESPIRSILSHSTPSKISFCNATFTVDESIDFFLNPLDKLFQDTALFQPGEDIWLVGHSLGGYLAGKYVMGMHQIQHENARKVNLSKLILASPVGFQPAPAPHERIASASLPPAFRIVDALWSSNFTPQSLVRVMGSSRGRSAIKRTLHGRIPHLGSSKINANASELDLLAEYLYHVTVAPASGEYAMNSLLEPAASEVGAGVYARQPLGGGKMMEALRNNQRKQELTSIKVLYGDHDWMRFNEVAARKECVSIRSYCSIDADVHVIPNAGHHLYLDNPDSFVDHILE